MTHSNTVTLEYLSQLSAWKAPVTVRVRKIFDRARAEAMVMGHEWIGTEHLLLALVSDPDGIAMTALRNLDLSEKDIRDEVMELVRPSIPRRPDKP